MRDMLIQTEKLEPGMKLSKPLFTKNSSMVLFPKDYVLNSESIKKAIYNGVGLVYIYDKSAPPDPPKASENKVDTSGAGVPAPQIPVRAESQMPMMALAAQTFQGETAAKVLIVDDEKDICDYIKMIIEDKNYKVLTAQNVNEAWSHLICDPSINTVFLDVKMPEIGGFELLKMIKSQIPRPVEVIMVTASRSMQDFILSRELGARDYVTKPFSPERLTKALQN
ncbi:MAG TPA: response regulator transcription factor [Candidatus Wallbacteria bacterium]|nr:response regulator transcription factor [Candidatus Wallbacteria bacterium]